MDAHGWTAKNIKTFQGREGRGFNATLYRVGKAVAFVMDDASGGEVRIDWKDRDVPRVEVKIIGSAGTTHSFQGTPEEKLLYEFAITQFWPADPSIGLKEPLRMSVDGVVGEIVEDVLEQRRLKKLCKTKTVFRLKNDEDRNCVWQTKAQFTPKIKAWLVQTHGDNLAEIVNETIG